MCMLAQLCPTLCNPMDGGPPGSSVHEIFQARILEFGKKKKEYWSLLPSPPDQEVDLPDPGVEPAFPVSLTLAGGFSTTEPHRKPTVNNTKL